MEFEQITGEIIGSAYKVFKALGFGFFGKCVQESHDH
jgi:hypothetical protein